MMSEHVMQLSAGMRGTKAKGNAWNVSTGKQGLTALMPLVILDLPAGYAHYLLAVAQHLMASPPAPLSMLLVVVMCFCLVAVSIWAQATQLHLPITFYRAQHTEVGQAAHAQQACVHARQHS